MIFPDLSLALSNWKKKKSQISFKTHKETLVLVVKHFLTWLFLFMGEPLLFILSSGFLATLPQTHTFLMESGKLFVPSCKLLIIIMNYVIVSTSEWSSQQAGDMWLTCWILPRIGSHWCKLLRSKQMNFMGYGMPGGKNQMYVLLTCQDIRICKNWLVFWSVTLYSWKSCETDFCFGKRLEEMSQMILVPPFGFLILILLGKIMQTHSCMCTYSTFSCFNT